MSVQEKSGERTEENPFGKPSGCQDCTLFKEPGIVWGSGNRNAKILYLGEAPGAEEIDYPRYRADRMAPFVGGAGRIRNALLQHAGIDKHVHLYTTNTVKCRPPANRLPTKFETACCARFLIEEIEDVNPNLIIAAGELALNTLTGKEKIGLWRGVPTAGPTFKSRGDSELEQTDGPSRTYKVFPTWHPMFLGHAGYNWPFAVHDYIRAKAQSEFPEIRRIPINLIRDASVPTHGGALLRSARERGAVTFDFETTGLSARSGSVLMCGFVARPDTAEVYDWTPSTQQLFQEILDSPEIEIIGQNILSFDLPFAEDKGHRVRWTNVFDTMVAFHLANSSYGQTTVGEQNAGTFRQRGTEKDLAFIASNHTDLEYWKSSEGYKHDLKGVCGLDCIATDRAATHPVDGLKAELERYGMTSLYYDHVLPVHPVLRKMTQRGVKIDLDRAARWSVILEQNADQLEKTLKEGLGDPGLNLNSSPQLQALLYGKLGLPVQYTQDKKKGRRPTCDAEALETLARIAPENAILRTIVDIRHLRKMNSTFIEPAMRDESIHPRFGVSKASNGRFNSWNPNAQNIPEMMRDIWIPDSPEHVLISADASQIEWRTAMILSGDPVGLELLASGVDNHRAVAAETLGKSLSDVSDHERRSAKFVVYGLGYGRGAASIAAGHGLALDFVENFIYRFFRRFNVFKTWRDELPKIVQEQHFLANPWKRRRWWYTREVTEVYNFPASSTAADMMIDELIVLDRQLPADATLRLTVHDEIVACAPKDLARETADCIRTVMQQTWPKIVDASRDPDVVKAFYPNGWYCPADVHVGENWKMCKSDSKEDREARTALEKELGIS